MKHLAHQFGLLTVGDKEKWVRGEFSVLLGHLQDWLKNLRDNFSFKIFIFAFLQIIGFIADFSKEFFE